ncbi:MAG: sigma-70 family RNA polymerase sigma factor [Deltaproteobacteria bacterium]|nr:sigma-70 family RNA polymerase sigma factor [Deltaproteobacteria bacterium]
MTLPVLADSIELYLNDIERFPILSREEEKSLALRYFETKDIATAHKLVTANLRFVVKIALEFQGYGINLRDLIQEGNIGLMTAVKKFNPEKGFRLLTYATWWIKSTIQEFILKSKGAVKRGAKALKKKLFYKDHNDEVNVSDLSLNVKIGEGLDGEDTYQDVLACTSPTNEEEVAEVQEKALMKQDVTTALATLSDKERRVIEARLLTEPPLSLKSIGTEFGVSRERIRQIEGIALKKMRLALTDPAQKKLTEDLGKNTTLPALCQ